jgi:hypothetical protein
MDSHWIIKSQLTALQIREHVSVKLDSNDKLLVSGLSGAWGSTGLSKEANDWLYQQL